MISKHSRKNSESRRESGQALVFLVLALAIVFLGAGAFSVDMSNLWFHRQAAQNAADATCVAGAMDLLVDAQGGATGHQGFTTGTPFNCSASSTWPICKYAAKNGYTSDGTGNLVSVSFPSSVTGVPTGSVPPAALAPTAFMRVDITDNVPTYFSGMLSGQRTQTVRAFAACGLVLTAAPIPILVLDPQSPSSTPPQAALNIQGNGTIAIQGGPARSIQVNSSLATSSCGQSNCSINLPWGSAKIDLSLGGPAGTGSDIAMYGAPATAPTGFIAGSTSHWIAPASPISDPFAQVCAPGQTGCAAINGNAPPATPAGFLLPVDLPACTTSPCNVNYHQHGCPDPGGCKLYSPGRYTSVIRVGPGAGGVTAIFDPGLYYVTGGLDLASQSTVRPGTGVGDGKGGVTFYFSGSSTISVAANSGTKAGLDSFSITTGPAHVEATSSYAMGVKCNASSTIPGNLPGNLSGNILLGPCNGYYGDPLGASAPSPPGQQRGFLFFQDRSARNVNPSWGGGGQFLLAGTMYFHSCNSSGTGVGCGAAPTYYNDIFSLSGNSGSGTFVLGNIITDNLTLGGTSGITMDLNPVSAYSQLRATLLR